MRSLTAAVVARLCFAAGPAAPLARGRSLGASGRITRAVTIPVASLATGPSIAAIAAIVPIAARAAVTAVVSVTRGVHLDDRLEPLVRRQQLEPSVTLGAILGDHDRHDVDAIEILLGLGLQLVADGHAGRQQRSIDGAARFAGAGGAPGPLTLGASARELDLDPRGHGAKPYLVVQAILHRAPTGWAR